MLLNTLLALFAVIVVSLVAAMFLDDSILSYFIRRESDVPVLNTNVLTPNVGQEFFMNTQISDDMPYNY